MKFILKSSLLFILVIVGKLVKQQGADFDALATKSTQGADVATQPAQSSFFTRQISAAPVAPATINQQFWRTAAMQPQQVSFQ